MLAFLHPSISATITLWALLWLCLCKIIPPSSKPDTATLLTGERWIRDQKRLFCGPPFSHCQVIFTPGPCGSAQCHTQPLHMAGSFICATRGGALAPPLKPNCSDIFKEKTQEQSRCRMVNIPPTVTRSSINFFARSGCVGILLGRCSRIPSHQ